MHSALKVNPYCAFLNFCKGATLRLFKNNLVCGATKIAVRGRHKISTILNEFHAYLNKALKSVLTKLELLAL